MQQIYIESYFRSGYTRFMNYISNIAHMSKEDQATITNRIKIIEFFDEYGKEAAKKAFNVSRSTVFLWKKKLREDGGRLSALAPLSTKPKRYRKSTLNPKIKEFIRDYRLSHPGVGKETIKTELDTFCLKNNLSLISESTIGRIIKELKEKGQIPITNKLSYYARTGRLKERI